MSWTDRIIVAFLVALFTYSGIDKILHYQEFINALADYTLTPSGWARSLAMPLILAELAIGLGLLVPAWRRQAALCGAVLLGIFTLALIVNYFTGNRGICGCWFTITLAQSTSLHIAQNLVFAGLALSLWWPQRTTEEPRAEFA